MKEFPRLQYLLSILISGIIQITGAEEERLGLFCNHTRPPPLITPSSEATVHFHSNSFNQDAGFQIHYSVVEGIY